MNDQCLFCKMIEGKIPFQKIFENEKILGLVDIHPQAKIHLLFLHKNHTANINEMSRDPKAIGEVFEAINEYSNQSDLSQNGFRVVINHGKNAGQTVFHTHFHVLGGGPLGTFGGVN